MQSFAERVEWFQTHFPDLDDGTVRFFEVKKGESPAVTLDYSQRFTTVVESGEAYDHVDYQVADLDKPMEGEPHLIANVFITDQHHLFSDQFKSTFQHVSAEFSSEIDKDYAFFHEIAHVLHSRILINDFSGRESDRPYLDEEDEAQIAIYKEIVADQFATLMTIQKYGAEGAKYAKFIADMRILDAVRDFEHFSTFGIDGACTYALRNMGSLKKKTPQELFDKSLKLAKLNFLYAEMHRQPDKVALSTTSLMTHSVSKALSFYLNLADELHTAQIPLSKAENLSETMRNRFREAAHRQIRMRDTTVRRLSENERTFRGFWANPTAKYLHAQGEPVSPSLKQKMVELTEVKELAAYIRLYGKCFLVADRFGEDAQITQEYCEIFEIHPLADQYKKKVEELILDDADLKLNRRLYGLDLIERAKEFAIEIMGGDQNVRLRMMNEGGCAPPKKTGAPKAQTP